MVEKAKQDADLTPAQLASLRKAILKWGRYNRAEYPWRREGVPLWQRLIAEVMLVRTKADQVVPIWTDMVNRFPTPSSLARVSQSKLYAMVAPLGLEWRAARLHDLIAELAHRDGMVPLTKRGLTGLPAVGEYCSSAFLSLHTGTRAILIDSNVVRLMCRYTGRSYDGETRRRAWLRNVAERLTPKRRHRDFNYAILDLAMSVCRPHPECERCPLSRSCHWYLSHSQA